MPPQIQRDDEILEKSARSCDPLILPDVHSEEKFKSSVSLRYRIAEKMDSREETRGSRQIN